MRLIDADKVYPWYLEAFSAEKIGKEREVKPNEARFSMNDIRENLSNIATEQELRIGHWIKHDGCWECSECHTERAYGNEYCPDCGSHNGDIAKPYKESEAK